MKNYAFKCLFEVLVLLSYEFKINVCPTYIVHTIWKTYLCTDFKINVKGILLFT